jgi:hypothetical protein
MAIVDQKFSTPIIRWWRLFVPLLLLTGCAGCGTTGPILSASQPNVVIFRAMAGYYPYLGEFEERMLEEGVCPTVALPAAHRQIAERIIAARNNGRLNGPLVIVGYSTGADKALLVSRRLGECGITVDKLVLLEASAHGCVPGNVTECVNIYKSQAGTEFFPFFRGCTVVAESADTRLVNYNVRDYNDGRYDWDNHFTLTFNPYVREMMFDEVMAGVEGEPAQDEMLSGQQNGDQVNVAEESPRSMN